VISLRSLIITHLAVCVVAKQGLDHQISHVLAIDGAADTLVLSQHAAACGRVILQAAWPDDGPLQLATSALPSHTASPVLTVQHVRYSIPILPSTQLLKDFIESPHRLIKTAKAVINTK
jgi:hypothetical protein